MVQNKFILLGPLKIIEGVFIILSNAAAILYIVTRSNATLHQTFDYELSITSTLCGCGIIVQGIVLLFSSQFLIGCYQYTYEIMLWIVPVTTGFLGSLGHSLELYLALLLLKSKQTPRLRLFDLFWIFLSWVSAILIVSNFAEKAKVMKHLNDSLHSNLKTAFLCDNDSMIELPDGVDNLITEQPKISVTNDDVVNLVKRVLNSNETPTLLQFRKCNENGACDEKEAVGTLDGSNEGLLQRSEREVKGDESVHESLDVDLTGNVDVSKKQKRLWSSKDEPQQSVFIIRAQKNHYDEKGIKREVKELSFENDQMLENSTLKDVEVSDYDAIEESVLPFKKTPGEDFPDDEEDKETEDNISHSETIEETLFTSKETPIEESIASEDIEENRDKVSNSDTIEENVLLSKENPNEALVNGDGHEEKEESIFSNSGNGTLPSEQNFDKGLTHEENNKQNEEIPLKMNEVKIIPEEIKNKGVTATKKEDKSDLAEIIDKGQENKEISKKPDVKEDLEKDKEVMKDEENLDNLPSDKDTDTVFSMLEEQTKDASNETGTTMLVDGEVTKVSEDKTESEVVKNDKEIESGSTESTDDQIHFEENDRKTISEAIDSLSPTDFDNEENDFSENMNEVESSEIINSVIETPESRADNENSTVEVQDNLSSVQVTEVQKDIVENSHSQTPTNPVLSTTKSSLEDVNPKISETRQQIGPQESSDNFGMRKKILTKSNSYVVYGSYNLQPEEEETRSVEDQSSSANGQMIESPTLQILPKDSGDFGSYEIVSTRPTATTPAQNEDSVNGNEIKLKSNIELDDFKNQDLESDPSISSSPPCHMLLETSLGYTRGFISDETVCQSLKNNKIMLTILTILIMMFPSIMTLAVLYFSILKSLDDLSEKECVPEQFLERHYKKAVHIFTTLAFQLAFWLPLPIISLFSAYGVTIGIDVYYYANVYAQMSHIILAITKVIYTRKITRNPQDNKEEKQERGKPERRRSAPGFSIRPGRIQPLQETPT